MDTVRGRVIAGVIFCALAGAAGGCPSVDPYACTAAEQCVRGGTRGICEPSTSRCAFPDEACESGWRYPERTDAGLGGVCLEPAGSTTSSSGTTGEAFTSTTGDSSSIGSSSESTTTPSSSTTEDACALVPSEPQTYSGENALEVAELDITAEGVPALRIEGSPGALVRDLEISFSGSAGIVVVDSPGTIIERVQLRNAGAPKTGHAALSEIGIRVERSEGVVIRDVYVEDARSGVVVIDSDDAVLEQIWVQDARGEITSTGRGSDEGGDCVLLQTSTDVRISGFGCTNTPDGFEPHAGIFVDRCTGAVVEEGIAENIDQGSGAGVRVHTNDETSNNVVVRDVDVVGGSHACYDTVEGRDVTFENTGCRNHDGNAWMESFVTPGPLRVIGGRYYNVANVSCCDEAEFTEFDAVLDQFVPRLPPAVVTPCG